MVLDGGEKAKILLVEDDVFMIELLVHEFTAAGFDVSVAKTGTEGVAKFFEVKPDLILLDLVLPDEKGFEALRKIRRDPVGATVKVIVLTNLSDTSDIEEGKRLGAVDYLVKANYSLPEIVVVVRKALGMR